jgi:hypothetical protein
LGGAFVPPMKMLTSRTHSDHTHTHTHATHTHTHMQHTHTHLHARHPRTDMRSCSILPNTQTHTLTLIGPWPLPPQTRSCHAMAGSGGLVRWQAALTTAGAASSSPTSRTRLTTQTSGEKLCAACVLVSCWYKCVCVVRFQRSGVGFWGQAPDVGSLTRIDKLKVGSASVRPEWTHRHRTRARPTAPFSSHPTPRDPICA